MRGAIIKQMEVSSRQIATDLMLRSFEGQVEHHDGVIAVRTPSNPTFRWGNFLVFDRPPAAGDLAWWPRRFAETIGTTPGVDHLAFTWDAPGGEVGAADAFVQAGYERTTIATLTTRALGPEMRAPSPCTIRALTTDADWAQWVALAEAQNAALPADEREGPGHLEFVERAAAGHRAMISAGWGRWFGAFVDGRLAASMGLFVQDGLGRFQSVDTHPAFRRRGLATTLLRHVATEGLTAMGADTLVIAADVADVAIGIYRTAGFTVTESITQLERRTWPSWLIS